MGNLASPKKALKGVSLMKFTLLKSGLEEFQGTI
jgi:hypothetical protein